MPSTRDTKENQDRKRGWLRLQFSLKWLFVLTAIVAAFFAGRHSSMPRAEQAEKRQRELETQVATLLGFELYSDAFAEKLQSQLDDLNYKAAGLDRNQTIALLNSVDLDIERLPIIPTASTEGFLPYIYVLSPSYWVLIGHSFDIDGWRSES